MNRYSVSAHYIHSSFDLAEIESINASRHGSKLVRKERNLLAYSLGDEGKYLCVYSFGAITIFGVDNFADIIKLVRDCTGCGADGLTEAQKVSPEDYSLMVSPDEPESVEFNHVRIRQLTLEKVLLVSHVIAQSVAIDFIDARLKSTLRLYDDVNSGLKKLGRIVISSKQILKTVGTAGSVTNFLINRLVLLDKPDITWEDREAEALYMNLRRMFELDDRFSALRLELEYLRKNSDTLMTALASRRSETLSLIIIILIVLGIIMGLPNFLSLYYS